MKSILGLPLLIILAYEALTCQAEEQASVLSGDYKFSLFTDFGSYDDAVDFCGNDGGWVAEPQTEELNYDLTRIMNDDSIKEFYFIGLRRKDSTWKWEKDGNPMVYKNWLNSENIYNDETYAATSDWKGGKGKWANIHDDGEPTVQFACQYDPCKSITCSSNEECSVSNTEPDYYTCKCQTGHYGKNCQKYLAIISDAEVTAVKGYPFDISGKITTTEDAVTVKLLFDGDMIAENTDAESGAITFTLPSILESSGGNYTFKAISPGDAYIATSVTLLIVYDPCKESPCQNDGSCSVINTRPNYYVCTCKSGYYGDICTNYLAISSDKKATAVKGYQFEISANVSTIGNNATVELHFDGKLIDNRTNVDNGTVTFTLHNITEGEYTFNAIAPGYIYYAISNTSVEVNVEACIESLSTDFIFSPITTGSENVTCQIHGKPTPLYGWYVNNREVTTTAPSKGVYQTIDNATYVASLNVNNAKLSDDGTYMCRATNRVGEERREVTKYQTITLEVYGSPIIESTSARNCTDEGTITMTWTPNNQTKNVKHRLIIYKGGEKVSQQDIFFRNNKTLIAKGLEPNTLHNATIMVCPDECIEFLSDSVLQKTGEGTPGPVSNPRIHSNQINTCTATWEQPNSTSGVIVSYEIEWRSNFVYNPNDVLQEDFVTIDTVESEVREVATETEPNRKYTAFVNARTCARDGDTREALGSCITPPAPPENVTQPDVADAEDDSSTRQITIPPIDYTNGPVSCIYVVVQKEDTWNGKKFNPEDLKTLTNNAINGNKSEYLSLALPGDSIGPDGNVTNLGDASTTDCDATSPSRQISRRKRAAGDHVYEARNIELEHTGVTYSFLILTATPVDNTFQLNQSPVQRFVQGSSESGSSIVWVAGVVVGVLLLTAIPAFVYFRRNRASKGDNDSDMPLRETSDISRPEVSDKRPEQRQKKQGHKIPLEMLENVYRAMKSNESMEFRTEFGELKRVAMLNAPSSDFGKDEALKKKNRFKNIIPYDSTRVILQGGEGNGYINACYVKGPNKTFIASQGPLPNTVHDFWRMVVEQQCRIIVMLTKCEEAGKKKCERYWPNAMQVVHHGLYIVRNMNEKHFGGYVKRELKILTQSDEEFTVGHYQFLGWPDHGVPKITSNFFRLHHEVMKSHAIMKTNAPILVHCSAGVGRTGAFIGFDILLAESKKRKSIDVYNCVMEMRQQRVDMVQTCGQYEFLHKLLLENYLFGETDVSEEELLASNKRKVGTYQKEFQNLTKVESLPSTEENAGFSPGFGNRVVIVRQPDDTEWITIDATFVEAYHHDTRLMAAQSPSKSTVEYFWRAILDNEVDAVVMLNSIELENGGHEQYWPYTRNQVLRVNNLSIRMVAENEIRGTVHRSLVVSREVRQQIQKREIKHYQYLGWRERAVPEDPHGIIDLLDDTRNRERRFNTVLVHSSKGIGRTGTFCALFNLMERLKNENNLDVFRAVKDLRELRPRMVDNLEQYKFCYDVATEYLTSRNVYANEALESGPTGPVYENL